MKKSILLIEDNADVRENTTEILELAGYNVITAPNGKVGVEHALKDHPDLIVCDIMMPELDGYAVLHALNKNSQTTNIPFIFLTAKTEKLDIRKGMSLGADDYLTKPFDDTELLNAIEVRLNKSEMRQKSYESSSEGLENFITDARKALNLKNLCKDKKVKVLKKKAGLFSEGDLPLNIYYLKSGSIKVYKSHPDGKELITNIYDTNDFFGFEPILEGNNYQETAVALQDSEVVVIPKYDFITLLQAHPDVSKSFIGLLCKKLAEREKQLLNVAYNSVRQRTAEALLKVRMKDSQDIIQLSRDDLAKIVATASESVIRILSDFKDEGLIEIDNGKIRITQPTRLERVVRWSVSR
ncbi:MAG: transcriptional regulator [Marivirga sp.]|nr:transcriptional regulator [Marivirga sp.]